MLGRYIENQGRSGPPSRTPGPVALSGRWRPAGGNDLASLGLIAVVAAIGLGSFAFHALATLGAVVLSAGPIAVFICSHLFLALHRFLRLPALIAVGVLLGFVMPSTLTQPLVPTGIFKGSSGYVPALDIMCLVAVLALLRARIALAREAAAPIGMAQGRRNARGKLAGCC